MTNSSGQTVHLCLAACWLQNPGLLQTLQATVAQPQDIFYVNFGRWHFSNCAGLQSAPYKQSLWNLGKLYEVRMLDTGFKTLHILPGSHWPYLCIWVAGMHVTYMLADTLC